jgi:hypothetical protein
VPKAIRKEPADDEERFSRWLRGYVLDPASIKVQEIEWPTKAAGIRFNPLQSGQLREDTAPALLTRYAAAATFLAKAAFEQSQRPKIMRWLPLAAQHATWAQVVTTPAIVFTRSYGESQSGA